MKVHKDLLAKVAEHCAVSEDGAFSVATVEDRALLVSFLLHCADLSNPLAPPAKSRHVADLVSTEFNAQAKLEQEAGLPVSVMTAHDEVTKAKMELGFIDFVVNPLYEQMVKIVPELEITLALIKRSRMTWEAVAKAAASADSQ